MLRGLIFIVCLLAFTSCRRDVLFETGLTKYRVGDNPSWAAKNYNDTTWKYNRGITGNKVFWGRTHVDIIKRLDTTGPMGVQVHAFGAYDFYWDGVLIGHNGKPVSTDAKEIPGTEATVFMLPDSLVVSGRHVAAFRLSQVSNGHDLRDVELKLQNYKPLLRDPLILTAMVHLMAGVFFIASLYYFLFYFNSKQREYSVLIFAFTGLFFFCLLIVEYVKYYIEIPYTHFFIRLKAVGILTFLIALLVPYYFSIQLGFKKKLLLLSLMLGAYIVVFATEYGHYDYTSMLFSLIMWLFCLVIAIDATRRKVKGGIIVLIGMLAIAVVHRFALYDIALFISYTIIVTCMLYLHVLRARVLEEQFESTLLLSSRLQLELVKKNIQPHFLRNTLTSLIDWVEESPKQGVEFIKALSDEFNIMNAISEKTLVPIAQEIEFCKKHLSVMQFRKEINYVWEDEGILPDETLPPAVIHTLLENGITHGMPLDNGSIYFKLEFFGSKKKKQYIFKTHSNNGETYRKPEGGNGFKYIRARLNESYGDNWAFTSNEADYGWISVITIFT